MRIHTQTPAHAFTVSELNRQVKSLLESSFLQIRVQGELSSFSRPSSGHWYFTLKDDKAQIRCAMFKSRNAQVRFTPKEGDQIILTGRVSLYEGRGDFQLIGDMMENDGTGKLQAEFEALKARLASEGLFNQERKRAIPRHPKHLAVITSPTGAAIHDILSVLKRRFPSLPVTLYPAAVQGSEAAAQLIQAIAYAERHQQADLIIIGRGGGSLEDLWPFNDEQLARAIYHCSIPVISAVGHEVDFSISDYVADLRAPTPSAAAEIISPDQDALRIQIDRLQQRLLRAQSVQIKQLRQHLIAFKQRLRHPGERLNDKQRRLNHLTQRLQAITQRKLTACQHQHTLLSHKMQALHPYKKIQQQHHNLSLLEERLSNAINNIRKQQSYRLGNLITRINAVSPLATLERGYAIVQNQQGAVITDAKQVQAGELITNRLATGQLLCRVENSTSEISYD
jgi:exodeoxyribonuclease VII large subunit